MQDQDPQTQLNALKYRIDAARKQHDRAINGTKPVGNMSYGMRIGLDLVSGVLVGTAVGYGLDVWLESLPWLMLLGMGFGTAAGVRLMMETARKAAAAAEREEAEDKEFNNGR